MSRILTGDSEKLSFSTLTEVPFFVFDQTTPLDKQALPSEPA